MHCKEFLTLSSEVSSFLIIVDCRGRKQNLISCITYIYLNNYENMHFNNIERLDK